MSAKSNIPLYLLAETIVFPYLIHVCCTRLDGGYNKMLVKRGV